MDESGASRAMCRTHARARKGERAHASAPQNYGANVTILSGLSLQGIRASMYREGPSDGSVFLACVREVLVPALRPGTVVFLDNLSSHKSPLVAQAIEAAGARLLFLPPSSARSQPDRESLEQTKGSSAQASHPQLSGAGPRHHPRPPTHHPRRCQELLPIRPMPTLTQAEYALADC